MTVVKELVRQMVKFSLVGGISFIIDWGILNLLVIAFHINATLAGTISFLVSLAFNYVASMKYVFTRREDMAKWMEILIFFVSSAIGLALNGLIIWVATGVILPAGTISERQGLYILYTNIGKLIATVIVSVWNFGTRKWLLDAPREGTEASPLSAKIGAWSLTHTPKGWPR